MNKKFIVISIATFLLSSGFSVMGESKIRVDTSLDTPYRVSSAERISLFEEEDEEINAFLLSLEQEEIEHPDIYTMELIEDIPKIAQYDCNNLRAPSNVTAESLDVKFAGTGMQGLGQAFVQAEKDYNINAAFLAALCVQESAWGNSSIAKKKNNLAGFAAYDSSPGSSAGSFKSKEACVDFVAKYIDAHYLTEGGKYYSKDIYAMNERYASDKGWAKKISGIAYKLIKE